MSAVSSDFERFGGSYLLSEENYYRHISGYSKIGRQDGQFMIPTNQMNDLLKNHPNDPREWERQLGLPKTNLGNSEIHRVDVYSPQNYEPRLPTNDLSGSNALFIPGGKTPGGQDECVINQFPNPENNSYVGKITTLNPTLENSTSQAFPNSMSQLSENTPSTNPSQTNPRDIDLKADLGLNNDPAPSSVKAVSNGIQ